MILQDEQHASTGDSMIHTLREKASPSQINDMLQEYETMIKIVVDTRQYILSGDVG